MPRIDSLYLHCPLDVTVYRVQTPAMDWMVIRLSLFFSFSISASTNRFSIKKVVSYRSAEIVIVLALSEVVSISEYERMIGVIRALPDSIRMGKNNGECQMAIADANSFDVDDMTDVEQKIRFWNHRRSTGQTTTHLALHLAAAQLSTEYPNRMLPAQIFVLITDGKPTDPNWQEDFAKTEQMAQDLRDSLGVVFYVSYVGIPSAETMYHLKRITGDSSRVFSSNVFSDLANALNKSLEVVEYRCENEVADNIRTQMEATGCNSTCTEVANCPSSHPNQPPEQIDYPPPISIGIGLALAYFGGVVSILVLEGMVFIVWKRRATGRKDMGQRETMRWDAVQNHAYYQKVRRNIDIQVVQYVEPSSTNVYECIEDADGQVL